jgi:hypothetical protein
MTAIVRNRIGSFVSGLGIKAPCKAVSIADLTLAGEQTVNGVACVVGDRVLVNAQTDPVENGIYNVETSAWQRSDDFDGARDAVRGTVVSVVSPGGASDIFYQLTSDDPVEIDVDEITFIARTVLMQVPRLATSAQLDDIASDINTDGTKEIGYEVYNTDTGMPVWASGSAAGSSWNDAMAGTAHSPM